MPSDLTDEQARALGERWVKAGGGWRPGMWARPADPADSPSEEGGWRVSAVEASGTPLFDYEWYGGLREPLPEGAWPDLRDPATKGAALGFLRERLNRSGLATANRAGRWYVGDWHYGDRGEWEPGFIVYDEGSEEAALVAALEAAPC
jgi:hypothetical protein